MGSWFAWPPLRAATSSFLAGAPSPSLRATRHSRAAAVDPTPTGKAFKDWVELRGSEASLLRQSRHVRCCLLAIRNTQKPHVPSSPRSALALRGASMFMIRKNSDPANAEFSLCSHYALHCQGPAQPCPWPGVSLNKPQCLADYVLRAFHEVSSLQPGPNQISVSSSGFCQPGRSRPVSPVVISFLFMG